MSLNGIDLRNLSFCGNWSLNPFRLETKEGSGDEWKLLAFLHGSTQAGSRACGRIVRRPARQNRLFMIDAEAGRLFPEFGEYQQIQDFEAGEGPKLCIFAL